MVKNLPAIWETWVQSLSWEDPLEEGIAIHSSVPAWRIPWTEEPGGLQPMELQRVGHDWETDNSTGVTWTLIWNIYLNIYLSIYLKLLRKWCLCILKESLLYKDKYGNIYGWNYGVWHLLQSNPAGSAVINETRLVWVGNFCSWMMGIWCSIYVHIIEIFHNKKLWGEKAKIWAWITGKLVQTCFVLNEP